MSQFSNPMPVLPVDSVYPHQPSERPAAITPVGIISIVIAAITGIAALMTIIFSLVTHIAAAEQRRQVAVTPQMYPIPTQPPNTYNPDLLTRSQAQQALSGLRQIRPLSAKQSEQVVTLLENHGKKIFPFDASAITASRVKSNVSDSGEFLGSGGKMSVYYILGNGRLEASDSQAIFRSDDNITVFRSGDLTNDQSLSEADIDQFIQETNSWINTPLNDAQQKTLRSLLRDSKQVISSDSRPLVPYAVNMNDKLNSVWIISNNSIQIQLDQEGAPGLFNSSAPMPGTNPFSGKKITTGWATGLLIGAVVNGILAILLLIAGIQFLRGRPSGRKLHLIYGWFQLPLMIVIALLFAMTINEWITAQSTSRPPSPMVPSLTGILLAIAGIIWPIIILITMTRKSIRDYFTGVM